MACVLSSVDDILALATASPEGVVRAAVFDADGTLWRGDIGDAAFAGAVEAGLVLDATYHGPLRAWATRWDIVLDADKGRGLKRIMRAAEQRELEATEDRRGWPSGTWRSELYAMQAWIYAGHTSARVEAYGVALFDAGFADGIFADMRRLLEGLAQLRVAVWIASASHTSLVVPGAARLGVARARVLGMEPVVDDAGVIGAALRRSSYGPGKAAAVHDALGGRPLLAFGDSVLGTDRELLALAHAPVAVASKGLHREAALADARMFAFDPK